MPHHAVLCSEGNTLQMAQPGLPGPTRAEADPGLQFNRAHVPLAPARRWHLDDTSFQCLVVSCVGHSASEILSCDPWGGLRLLAALDPPYGCMDRCPHSHCPLRMRSPSAVHAPVSSCLEAAGIFHAVGERDTAAPRSGCPTGARSAAPRAVTLAAARALGACARVPGMVHPSQAARLLSGPHRAREQPSAGHGFGAAEGAGGAAHPRRAGSVC